MTENNLEEIHQRMLQELQKHGAHKDNCSCRKPHPGMLIQVQKKWDIDLTKSYVIGDAQSDIEAGQQAGCQGILTTELEKIVARLP